MTGSLNALRRTMGMIFPAALLFASLSTSAQAQQTEETKLEKVEQRDPGYLVRADVDRTDRVYREGEPLFVTAICEKDAYLYVLYRQADGKTFQVYPNSKQKNNFVKAMHKVQIPAGDDQFRWRVGAPYGKETIMVLAPQEPIDALQDESLREKLFNEVDAGRAKKTAMALKDIDPSKWAKDYVEITTKAKTEPAVAAQARRYGVFFGVKEYLFHDEAMAAQEELVKAGKLDKAKDPNMPFAENNVAIISQMFKSMGKLDDSKSWVSKEATKANLKYAVTEWLPSVSKPGDTVFIYWSSHGSQMPDDDGDEADQLDEWLCVTDYVDGGILNQLVKKKAAGQLDAAMSPRVDELVQIAQQAGDNATLALIRETAVSDDLFGHWLQSLAGRQIVVILDTCHSGGFFVNEKGIEPANKNVTFDFLDGETSRLKDLGQKECAMMTACSHEKVCYINHFSDEMIAFSRMQQKLKGEANFDHQVAPMFVFTYYLAESLAAMQSPADLQQVHSRCVEGMKGYFSKINQVQREDKLPELTPHEAILYNLTTKPVIMKP